MFKVKNKKEGEAHGRKDVAGRRRRSKDMLGSQEFSDPDS